MAIQPKPGAPFIAGENAGTSVTVAVPEIVAGDCALIMVYVQSSTAPTMPAGWTEVGAIGGAGASWMRTYAKTTPTLAESITITVPVAGFWVEGGVWNDSTGAAVSATGTVYHQHNSTSQTSAPSAPLTLSNTFIVFFGVIYAARLYSAQLTAGTITATQTIRAYTDVTLAGFKQFIVDALVTSSSGGQIVTDFSGSNTTSTVRGVALTSTPSGGGGDTTAPAVAITAPAAGASISSGSLTVTATVTDAVGVSSVTAKLGTTTLGPLALTSGTSYSGTFSVAAVTNGDYTITVNASDAAGNVGTASRSVTIANPAPPAGSTVDNWDGAVARQHTEASLRVRPPGSPLVRGFWYNSGSSGVRANRLSHWSGTVETPLTLPPQTYSTLNGLSYCAYGDSYGVMQSGGTSAGVDYTAADLFPQQVGALLGSAVTNRHVNSYMAMDVAYLMNGTSASAWTANAFGLVTIHVGGNDTKVLNTPAGKNAYRNGLDAIVALTRMASRVTAQSGTVSGTWTNIATGTSGAARSSAAAGAALTLQATGPELTVLLLAARDGSGSPCTITVDGGAPMVGTTVGQATQNPSVTGSYGLVPVNLRGLSSGTHTIVITNTGSGTLVVDSVLVRATSPASVPFLVLSPPAWPTNPTALFGAAGIAVPSEADFIAYQELFDGVRWDWAADAKIDAVLQDSYRQQFWLRTDTEDLFINDNYHPNKVGHDALRDMWYGNLVHAFPPAA